MKIFEPEGMFRVEKVSKPFLNFGRMWFTQTLEGRYQLHVGVFDPVSRTLRVWKTRDIRPKVKLVFKGVRQHPRNPILDEEIYERVVRVPFLVKA